MEKLVWLIPRTPSSSRIRYYVTLGESSHLFFKHLLSISPVIGFTLGTWVIKDDPDMVFTLKELIGQ